jgi:hypothetical protein
MDNVDMDNLSTDMQLRGKLALPLGETEFSIKDLLDRYKVEDSLMGVGVDGDGVVMLYVENIVDYETPDLSESFRSLIDDVMNFDVVAQPFKMSTILGYSTSYVPTGTIAVEKEEPFDFNELNNNDSTQKITRILFKKTTVEVTVDTYEKDYPPGFLVVTMQIPGTDDSIVIDIGDPLARQEKTNLEINLEGKKTTSYRVKFKLNGNGETEISADAMIGISVAFKETKDYMIFGNFYYNDGKRQMQPYHVDLFSYLPEGTNLRFCAPSFKFNVTSNIGIPFIFELDTMTSYNHDGTTISVRPNLAGKNVIHRAATASPVVTGTITIDKECFPDGNIASIFQTNLDSISADYAFRSLGVDEVYPEAPAEAEEQFIGSDSRLRMTFSAQMPFWLDTGSVIAYTDTIEDVVEDIDNDYITSASLIFSYTSHLPIGIEITIALLDENRQVVDVSSKERYRYLIEAAPVDEEGAVSSPVDGSFSIDYESIISDLKKAKRLVVKVRATGETSSSRIKITERDKFKVKAELRAEGGFSVSPGKN